MQTSEKFDKQVNEVSWKEWEELKKQHKADPKAIYLVRSEDQHYTYRAMVNGTEIVSTLNCYDGMLPIDENSALEYVDHAILTGWFLRKDPEAERWICAYCTATASGPMVTRSLCPCRNEI